MKLPQDIDSDLYKKWCVELSDFPREWVTSLRWSAAACLLEVEDSFFFIKRSQQMRVHPGQIGFLAGGVKEGEENPKLTALREFEEETGIEFQGEVLGLLPPVMTAGSKILIPVHMRLAMSKEEFSRVIKSNGEWSEGVFVPIKDLSQSVNWSFSRFHGNRVRRIYFFGLHKYMKQGELLWGATARVVIDFLKIQNAMV